MTHRTEAKSWLLAAIRELERGNLEAAERAICRAWGAIDQERHEREVRAVSSLVTFIRPAVREPGMPEIEGVQTCE